MYDAVQGLISFVHVCRKENVGVHFFSETPKKHRGERIRTSDLLVPNQALYQAKLRPEKQSGEDARGDICMQSEKGNS